MNPNGAPGEQGDVGPRRVFGVFPLSRSLAVRLVLSLVLVVVSLQTNRSFLAWGLFVIFAILVVPIGRARSFLFSFVPYAGVWFIFTALRSLADETTLARTTNTKVATFERYIFQGRLPTQSLQDRLFDINRLHWYDYATTFVHWSYFIIPHAVAIRLWYRNPSQFRRYLASLTLLLSVGLAIYFLIPSNPPWMSPEQISSPAAPTPDRIMATIAKQLGGGLYQASYKVIGESNPIAAMPSIHMAVTFLLVFPAFQAGKRWGILALAYAGAMAFSLIYLGEHYFVDVVAGALVTTYGWVAAGVWIRHVAPALSRSYERPRPSSTAPSAATTAPAAVVERTG